MLCPTFSEPPVGRVSTQGICRAVTDILQQYDFTFRARQLLQMRLEEFGFAWLRQPIGGKYGDCESCTRVLSRFNLPSLQSADSCCYVYAVGKVAGVIEDKSEFTK